MAIIIQVVTFPDPPNSVVLYSTDDITMLGLLSHQSSASYASRRVISFLDPPNIGNTIPIAQEHEGMSV